MRAVMMVMAAAAILTACAAIPEAKRVEIPAAVAPHPPMVCRRITVKVGDQFEVVLACQPVSRIPADAYDQAPKGKGLLTVGTKYARVGR